MSFILITNVLTCLSMIHKYVEECETKQLAYSRTGKCYQKVTQN